VGWREKVANVQGSGVRTFPEPYAYTPVGGAQVTGLSGIFREAAVEEELGMERAVVSQRYTLDVRLADIPTPQRGDLVELTDRARTFQVDDSEEDGEGMSKLHLVETS